jgi:hypothetical protein
LIDAVKRQDGNAVQALLKRSVDVNSSQPDGRRRGSPGETEKRADG